MTREMIQMSILVTPVFIGGLARRRRPVASIMSH